MPTWAFGGLITLGIFLIGGLIAAVRVATKLNTTIEFLTPAVANVSESVKDLGVVVNKLIAQVAVLENTTKEIPAMSEAIIRLETDLAALSDKY